MITIHHLKKNFGTKQAVDIDCLQIDGSQLVGLVGNNGAGKTTLFRLILDLIEPSEGEVSINDKNVKGNEEWKTFTGTFIDSGFLIDFLTPMEYFLFIAQLNNIAKDQVENICERYQRFLPEKNDLQTAYIRDLSAGNKQKVGIVAALIHNPQIVLLDEPFNFLDPTSQSMLKHLLNEYANEHQATVIVSSHNLNHVADACQRVLLMEHGKILRDMSKADTDIEKELTDYFEVAGEL